MAISFNTPSIPTDQHTNNINQAFNRISSAQRINSAADDAAGLAISQRMTSQIDGFSTSIRNAGDGISLVQTASGAISSVTSNLERIRELSLQSANGTLTDTDRAALQKEADMLIEDTQNVLEKSNFNGVNLFNNNDSLSLQIGPSNGDQLDIANRDIQSQLDALGIADLDISTQQGASSAITVIDDASNILSERASELGGIANRLTTTIDGLQESRINTAESRSRIADADFAKEISELTKSRILSQVETSIQAQANSNAEGILRLLTP